MISNILECSRSTKYTMIPENILDVLNTSIKDASRYNPNKTIKFYYNLEIINLINLDELKLSRALDNIIGNAFEAMPDKDAFMWFDVQACENQAKIIIGNSESHIPDDRVDNVFDSQFTHGKKDGTGLGLSITKTIIEGHKGSIGARNVEHAPDFVPKEIRNIWGVEFVITLPLTDIMGCSLNAPLLENSVTG